MISPILPLYERADLDFSHGEGVYLYTTDGKRYLDFASGYAALALGHCHPKMVDAVQKQSQKLWHLSNRYKIPGMYEYCKKLIDNSFADTMFMANSGAEAVECMIKMARFKGTSKLDDFIDNQQFHGNAFQIFEQASNFMGKHLNIASSFHDNSFVRADKFTVPVLAVREAMINAVCHRNYQNIVV